jgi:hypothetical protein
MVSLAAWVWNTHPHIDDGLIPRLMFRTTGVAGQQLAVVSETKAIIYDKASSGSYTFAHVSDIVDTGRA